MIELTDLENKTVLCLKEKLWYNWGSEPGYSDVDPEELSKHTQIPIKKLRGVISSLAQKRLIYVEDVRGWGLPMDSIVYPTLMTYFFYGEAEDWVIDEMKYSSGMTQDEIDSLKVGVIE